MASNTNTLKFSELDKDKAKLFFDMLGDVVAMIISILNIFKKDNNNAKKVENTINNNVQ